MLEPFSDSTAVDPSSRHTSGTPPRPGRFEAASPPLVVPPTPSPSPFEGPPIPLPSSLAAATLSGVPPPPPPQLTSSFRASHNQQHFYSHHHHNGVVPQAIAANNANTAANNAGAADPYTSRGRGVGGLQESLEGKQTRLAIALILASRSAVHRMDHFMRVCDRHVHNALSLLTVSREVSQN